MAGNLRPVRTDLEATPAGPLRQYDKDLLLRWFEYRMTPETRLALMAEHPEAYNRWMGRTIAIVCREED